MSYILHQGALNGKPVLGVSINYRVAAFGFLDSEEVRVCINTTTQGYADSTGFRQ
jgi:triacylglycerol lipase